MRPISVAVLAAVLAAGLMAGCATTAPTTTAALPYQVTQGSLGLKAEEDPAYTLWNPFRMIAFVLYPAGLAVQRLVEIPYVYALKIDPALFGLNEVEQQYLRQRWDVPLWPIPDSSQAK